ncbi:hypothetical protein [Castellaniella sp.]|uniref:hypothetical protein n=1 Tax=Castellaniella sp. TaxID=1955812 RepID=UPI002AFF43CB|nr:hypothetical protein [Castellaniella sp.]
MRNPLTSLLARPAVASWIIARAQRTPYRHLGDYMGRWWLFNPYETADGQRPARGWLRRLLPSVRIHHIQRPDEDRHLHDHPWNARTVVLRGWYVEVREDGRHHLRYAGTTARLRFGEFHRITHVAPDGVWTLFITWRYRGAWGFLVDGHKVPWKAYLGADE